MKNPLDRRLEQAFAEIEPGRLSPDFQDHVMAELVAQPRQRRVFSPTAVLSAYWLLAAAMTVVVLAQIGWLELQWTTTTLTVALAALMLTVLPIVFFVVKINTSILDLIWNTVGD